MNGIFRLVFLAGFLLLISGCKPLCHIASCDVRKVHHHSGKIYRGQPIWKRQNPHIGEKIPKSIRENQKEGRKKQ